MHKFKAQTWYLVKVQFRPTNVGHPAILYTGFLDDKGQPGTYSALYSSGYDVGYRDVELYSLQIIREIISKEEWDTVYCYKGVKFLNAMAT